MKVMKKPIWEYKHMKVVICGAGNAGMGVAYELFKYKKKLGIMDEDALDLFYILD